MRLLKDRAIAFKWNSASREAAYILKVIAPFLIIKQAEAELGIAFQERIEVGKHSNSLRRKGEMVLTAEEIAVRQQIAIKMKELKTSYRHYS